MLQPNVYRIYRIHTPLLPNMLRSPALFFKPFPETVPLTVSPPSLSFDDSCIVVMFGALPLFSLFPLDKSSNGMSSGGLNPDLYLSITNVVS